VLALDHIDPRVLARAVDREEQLEANGIRVATFATEARSDTRCWTRLAELQAAAQIGWRDPDPRPEQTTSPVTGDNVRHSYESLGFVPEALFLAVVDNGDGLRYAGSRYRVLYSETGHPTLQAINQRLGFRREWMEVRLVRSLNRVAVR